MLGEILRRLRYWLQRGADADLNDEMRLHIEMRAAKLQASGLLPQEAWSEANRRFGSSLHLRERSRDMWLGHWIDELTRDLRIASRGLWRCPGFALAALLTLALGIGSNTAVFSVVNSVLLNPLPYPDADRLVAVANQAPGAQGLTTAKGDLLLSASMYVTFAEQNQTLDALGVWSMSMATVTGTGEAEQVRAVQISDGVLQALRVQPARGPGFASADYVPGGRAMVLLSDGYWRRRFGADPGIIGRSLIVDSRQLVVAGVMPAGFRLVDTEADLIYTFRFNRNQLELSGFGLQGLARLKPGVDINRANKDLARLIPVWMKSWPTVPGVSPTVYEAWRITPGLRPLKEEVVGDIGSVLWPVMGTLALVMLIVSANVAGLVLVRMQARQPELATRRALGASSGRILREVLMETLLLGLAGGLLGLTLAAVGVRLLAAYGPSTLPRLSEIAVDARAVLFALGYSILGAVLAGLTPH
ncbi:MAG: ABC transporter permease [Acidobacteria bacterium]|nr:ABC transporter permease [Acidobacteriota bacterium]